MTLLHYDTPFRISQTAPSSASLARRWAHFVVRTLGDFARHAADAQRRRSDQRALDALPLDLRKDIGWPAGDIHRL